MRDANRWLWIGDYIPLREIADERFSRQLVKVGSPSERLNEHL